MGLNLTVEGGNREQGVQETDSSSQQPERKALHHYIFNKIILWKHSSSAWDVMNTVLTQYTTGRIGSRGTSGLDATADAMSLL